METILKEMDSKINAISEMVTKILDNCETNIKQSNMPDRVPGVVHNVRLTIRSIKDVTGVTGNIKLVRGVDKNNQWFSFFIKDTIFETGDSVTVQYSKKEFNEKYNTMNLKGIKVLSGE